jgi:hypothetical protein
MSMRHKQNGLTFEQAQEEKLKKQIEARRIKAEKKAEKERRYREQVEEQNRLLKKERDKIDIEKIILGIKTDELVLEEIYKEEILSEQEKKAKHIQQMRDWRKRNPDYNAIYMRKRYKAQKERDANRKKG